MASAAFPFSSIPWLIQNRFTEICDTQTLATFTQINSWTLKLSKKRIKSVNIFEASSKNDLKNDSKLLLEIKKSLHIRFVSNLTFTNVSHIIPLYTTLAYYGIGKINIKILKHLIGPNLKTYTISVNIGYENVEQLEEFVDTLLCRNCNHVTIFFENSNFFEIEQIKSAFHYFETNFQGNGYFSTLDYKKDFIH